jgi:hypothetical protein
MAILTDASSLHMERVDFTHDVGVIPCVVHLGGCHLQGQNPSDEEERKSLPSFRLALPISKS